MISVQTKNGVFYVNRLEDFRELINDEGIYEGIEEFIKHSTNKDAYENLKLEFEYYEHKVDDLNIMLRGTMEECESLIEHIDTSKRIDKKKIRDTLENIVEAIYNNL